MAAARSVSRRRISSSVASFGPLGEPGGVPFAHRSCVALDGVGSKRRRCAPVPFVRGPARWTASRRSIRSAPRGCGDRSRRTRAETARVTVRLRRPTRGRGSASKRTVHRSTGTGLGSAVGCSQVRPPRRYKPQIRAARAPRTLLPTMPTHGSLVHARATSRSSQPACTTTSSWSTARYYRVPSSARAAVRPESRDSRASGRRAPCADGVHARGGTRTAVVDDYDLEGDVRFRRDNAAQAFLEQIDPLPGDDKGSRRPDQPSLSQIMNLHLPLIRIRFDEPPRNPTADRGASGCS